MHENDGKYGFLKDWMIQLTPQSNTTVQVWFKQGLRAWELLQNLPEGKEEAAQQELFQHSPKD